jgi:Terminase RNaseH-like domain
LPTRWWAEVNQGGDMVRSVLSAIDRALPIRTVRATRGKRLRAEPVAMLYAQGRVKHASPPLAALEDAMADFGLGVVVGRLARAARRAGVAASELTLRDGWQRFADAGKVMAIKAGHPPPGSACNAKQISEIGLRRSRRTYSVMSAFAGKADIAAACRHVRLRPEAVMPKWQAAKAEHPSVASLSLS